MALNGMRVATAAEPVAVAGAAQVTNSVGMKLVLISSGTFLMGSGESAEDAAAAFNKIYGGDLLKPGFFKDEYPQHRVRITRPFYLGVCHVTVGQFRKFVADAGYQTDAEQGEHKGALGLDSTTGQFEFKARTLL
jgi:formylglycine-generating enzyme required for sulfatase activity